MSRIHPKDLLAIPPEEASKLLALESETDEREKVTEFSWAVAIKMFEGKLMERPVHSDMYYMDGRLIKEESYMSHVTVEFCHEYGSVKNIIYFLLVFYSFRNGMLSN